MCPQNYRLSVILATYNRPRELRLVLEGLRQQRGAEFEVIVADDGSGPETRAAIDEIRPGFPRPILHVRHEDEGFRLAAIRNKAIVAATGEQLVFLDGDCIPFPDFIRSHLDHQAHRAYLCGQRMRLDERRSEAIDAARIARGSLAVLAPRGQRLREWGERWRAVAHGLADRRDRPKLIACNASAARQDVLSINGFDERFVGWGGEDDDFARRLRRQGLHPRSVIGRARLLHLHHPPDPTFSGTVRSGPNHAYLHRGYFLTRCRDGIEKRSIRDLRVHFLAAPAGVPFTGPAGGEGPCEVDVLFVPALDGGGFHDDADVRVVVVRGPTAKPDLLDLCHIALIPHGTRAPDVEARLAAQGKPCETLPPASGGELAEAILDSLDPLI